MRASATIETVANTLAKTAAAIITMRIIHAISCLLMLAFTLVQYNDPDFYFWMPIYGLPAVLAAIAAWSPDALRHLGMQACVAIGTVLAIFGTFIYWPRENFFWRQSVWWQSEAAREGMGMMVVTVVLLLLALGAWLRRTKHVPTEPRSQ